MILPELTTVFQCKHEVEKMWYGGKKKSTVLYFASIGVLSLTVH